MDNIRGLFPNKLFGNLATDAVGTTDPLQSGAYLNITVKLTARQGLPKLWNEKITFHSPSGFAYLTNVEEVFGTNEMWSQDIRIWWLFCQTKYILTRVFVVRKTFYISPVICHKWLMIGGCPFEFGKYATPRIIYPEFVFCNRTVPNAASCRCVLRTYSPLHPPFF